MRLVTEDKWKVEQSLVIDTTEDVKDNEPLVLEKKEEEPTQEHKVEEIVVEVKPVETSVVNSSESKCKEGISWASVV